MSIPAWNDYDAWAKITEREDASLTNQCSKCGVCGRCELSWYASYSLQCAFETNSRILKCNCCNFCHSRALTTDCNYRGTECISAANQTLCFWTEEQRLQHFESMKSHFVAHGMEGRPCRACCDHFFGSRNQRSDHKH